MSKPIEPENPKKLKLSLSSSTPPEKNQTSDEEDTPSKPEAQPNVSIRLGSKPNFAENPDSPPEENHDKTIDQLSESTSIEENVTKEETVETPEPALQSHDEQIVEQAPGSDQEKKKIGLSKVHTEPPPLPKKVEKEKPSKSRKGIIVTIFILLLVCIALVTALFIFARGLWEEFIPREKSNAISESPPSAQSNSIQFDLSAPIEQARDLVEDVTILRLENSGEMQENEKVISQRPTNAPDSSLRVIRSQTTGNVTSSDREQSLVKKNQIRRDSSINDWVLGLEVQGMIGKGTSGRIHIDGITYRSGDQVVGGNGAYFYEITDTNLVFKDGQGAIYLKPLRSRSK